LPGEVDEDDYDPDENRLRIAETNGAQEDEPMERDRLFRTSPDDMYLSSVVRTVRGVRAAQRGRRESGASSEAQQRVLQRQLPFPDQPLVPRKLPDSENPDVDLEEDDPRRCIICLSKEVKTMMMSCGHQIICNHCAQTYEVQIRQDMAQDGSLLDADAAAKCPECKRRIRQIVAVYGVGQLGTSAPKGKKGGKSKEQKKKKKRKKNKSSRPSTSDKGNDSERDGDSNNN